MSGASAAGALVNAIGMVSKALLGLMLNPAFLAIALAVGAVVAAWYYWDDIVAIVDKVGAAISDWWNANVKPVLEAAGAFLGRAVGGLHRLLQSRVGGGERRLQRGGRMDRREAGHGVGDGDRRGVARDRLLPRTSGKGDRRGAKPLPGSEDLAAGQAGRGVRLGRGKAKLGGRQVLPALRRGGGAFVHPGYGRRDRGGNAAARRGDGGADEGDHQRDRAGVPRHGGEREEPDRPALSRSAAAARLSR